MSESTTNRHVRDHASGTGRPKRAVLYLRVSSAGQVKTDYDPEGLSIPAQRQACQAKAKELGALIPEDGEYIEPGRTATTTDNRPRFMEMMARIKAERDVDYIVVYARSRLHRNVEDAAITRGTLRKLGVQLVSVMDYTEDSYIGDLVATVLDGVNEYQSKQSGADIRYKMSQKARNGGTITRAPIGYVNVREEIDGRQVATVKIDPERAPYVVMAFELYATGRHTFKSLLEALTEVGLRCRPRHGRPIQRISTDTLGSMLRDRYYLGKIEYQGEEYDGRHEPLIPAELFERVQRVLDVERHGGKRERIHNHYLKGLLWCGRCQRRLIVSRGKSRNGGLYFYYRCRGQQERVCDLPILPIERCEAEVARHYLTVRLSDDFRNFLKGKIDQTFADSQTTRAQVHGQLTKRLKELTALEDHYFDLVGNPAWPQAKLEARMTTIAQERTKIRSSLTAPRSNLMSAETPSSPCSSY